MLKVRRSETYPTIIVAPSNERDSIVEVGVGAWPPTRDILLAIGPPEKGPRLGGADSHDIPAHNYAISNETALWLARELLMLVARKNPTT